MTEEYDSSLAPVSPEPWWYSSCTRPFPPGRGREYRERERERRSSRWQTDLQGVYRSMPTSSTTTESPGHHTCSWATTKPRHPGRPRWWNAPPIQRSKESSTITWRSTGHNWRRNYLQHSKILGIRPTYYNYTTYMYTPSVHN